MYGLWCLGLPLCACDSVRTRLSWSPPPHLAPVLLAPPLPPRPVLQLRQHAFDGTPMWPTSHGQAHQVSAGGFAPVPVPGLYHPVFHSLHAGVGVASGAAPPLPGPSAAPRYQPYHSSYGVSYGPRRVDLLPPPAPPVVPSGVAPYSGITDAVMSRYYSGKLKGWDAKASTTSATLRSHARWDSVPLAPLHYCVRALRACVACVRCVRGFVGSVFVGGLVALLRRTALVSCPPPAIVCIVHLLAAGWGSFVKRCQTGKRWWTVTNPQGVPPQVLRPTASHQRCSKRCSRTRESLSLFAWRACARTRLQLFLLDVEFF